MSGNRAHRLWLVRCVTHTKYMPHWLCIHQIHVTLIVYTSNPVDVCRLCIHQMCCSVLQCVAVCSSVRKRCVTVCCSEMSCDQMCCSVLQSTYSRHTDDVYRLCIHQMCERGVLHCVAVEWVAIKCVAVCIHQIKLMCIDCVYIKCVKEVCYSVLQCVAVDIQLMYIECVYIKYTVRHPMSQLCWCQLCRCVSTVYAAYTSAVTRETCHTHQRHFTSIVYLMYTHQLWLSRSHWLCIWCVWHVCDVYLKCVTCMWYVFGVFDIYVTHETVTHHQIHVTHIKDMSHTSNMYLMCVTCMWYVFGVFGIYVTRKTVTHHQIHVTHIKDMSHTSNKSVPTNWLAPSDEIVLEEYM